MSHSELRDECVDYVLDEFDAGVPLHQILDQIHGAGYVEATIEAIRECLLLYGRITSLDQPIPASRWHPVQSAAPVYVFQQEPNYSDDARTQDPLTPNPAVEVPAFRCNPQAEQASSSCWDAAADEFAKNAHNQGQTVPQITESLHRVGYSTCVAAEVVTSLARQGVSNVRW